ncbi:MAG: hypothetical protein ACRDLF_07655 [Solirubrobacteraceae bacterium]
MSNNQSMQAAFPVVLFGSIGLFVVVGVLSMLTRNNLHDQIGQGGLSLGEDPFGGGAGGIGATDGYGGLDGWDGGEGSQARAERELEIRQMLTARSDRLVRQGQPPLDIDAELARLERTDELAPPGAASHNSALTDEVRQLVHARNERRRRQGLDALDVEAEVQRTLAELDPQ